MSALGLAHGFSAALEELHDQGIERKRIAQVLDVTPSAIARWATGERTIPVEKLPLVDQLCGQPRGHVLRLAGLVSDELDVASALRSDPHLDAEGRDLVSSLYAYCRRRHISEDADLVAAYRRTLTDPREIELFDRLEHPKQLLLAREWQRHLPDDAQERLAG